MSLEEDLYSLAEYAEIESYYSVAQPKAQENWANYVLALASKYELDLDLTALINSISYWCVRVKTAF